MTRPTATLRRLERILVMVPWLLDQPGVGIDEVAERFDVDREELLDDLDLLGYCGLPGYGGGDLIETSVFGDQVEVRMAHYFKRPLRLSVREAVTLLLAARALGGVEGLPESAPLTRAAEALERLLGAEAGAGARIAIDLAAAGDEHVPELRDAIHRRRVVRLTYRSGDGRTTTREVEPWTLAAVGGAWYLQGHCRLAGGPRDFRLDRIRELDATGQAADAPPEVIPPPVYRPAHGDPSVVLDLAPAARWVIEWAVVDAVEPARDDRTRVTLRTADLDWAARMVLRLGADAAVVAPAELAVRVGELARATLERYRRS
ncbi:MAG: WYL domain-containing protein [Euzebyales bacterium]|nr:WYL domain-containing protein [Euzebyales bacterium]